MDIRVYLWKDEMGDGASVTTAQYKTKDLDFDYDIANDSEMYELYVDVVE